jgi:hypothetical protein
MATRKSSTTKKSVKTSSERVYTPITRNIYKFGDLYRVRVSINGERVSQYFKSKKAALAFRKSLLSA